MQPEILYKQTLNGVGSTERRNLISFIQKLKKTNSARNSIQDINPEHIGLKAIGLLFKINIYHEDVTTSINMSKMMN